MATIKSTIALQSSGLFPGNINATSINTTDLSGSTSWQTVSVYKQITEGSLVNNPITAAHGALLYAQSPASNKRNICIYTVQSIIEWIITTDILNEYPGQWSSLPAPMMTLRPGESAMTRVSVDASAPAFFGPSPGDTGSIIILLEGAFDDLIGAFSGASVPPNADDVATLEYIFAEQGGAIGTSIGLLTSSNGRWQNQIMDFEKGKMSRLADLSLVSADWNNSNQYGVHEKGYVWRFTSEADSDQHSYRFIGPNGDIVWYIDDQTLTDYHEIHKCAVVVYRDGTELVFTVFDGVQAFEYRLVADNSYYLQETYLAGPGQWDFCMADGSIVVTVYNNNDSASTYILSGGNEPAQIFSGNNINNYFANFYISQFADTVVVAEYAGDGVYYDTVKIWNKSGVTVKTIDLTGLLIDSLDIYPYGNGCWAMVGTPNSTYGTDLIQLFAYDQATGILHGADLNWQVDTGVYDGGVVVVYEPKGLFASTNENRPRGSFDNDSLAFIAYDNIDYNNTFFLDQRSSYLKAFTLFPGKTAPTEHDLAIDTDIYWRRKVFGQQSGLYPTAKYIRLHVSATSRMAGPLQSITIKPGTALPVYTTIAQLDQIIFSPNDYYTDFNSGISYSPFGDYAMYAFYTTETATTSYRVLDERGKILDTLTTPYPHTSIGWNGFRTRYNSLLIRTLDSPSPTSYFNTKTKKFVTLPETYRNQDSPNMAWRSHTNNGVMLLRDSNSSSVKYWRILSNGTVSPKIMIPSQFSASSIERYMGETHFFVWFRDANRDSKYTFVVYDLAGSLVNTVLSNYENIDGWDSSGNRLGIYLYASNGNPAADAYVMITPTSSIVNYWVADSDYWQINLNDANWND